MGIGTLTLMGMLLTPGQNPVAAEKAPPVGVSAVNYSKLEIPISYRNKSDVRDLILFVSRNKNESWEQYAVASPDRDTFFSFTAPADGEYWFQMMIVHQNGTRSPADLRATPPALKVLIDTKSPVINIRSVDRVG